jgi:hypothetical protein
MFLFLLRQFSGLKLEFSPTLIDCSMVSGRGCPVVSEKKMARTPATDATAPMITIGNGFHTSESA